MRIRISGRAFTLVTCFVAVASWAAVSLSAEPPTSSKVVVYRDASLGPVRFAAGELRTALSHCGLAVAEKSLEELPDAGPAGGIVLAVSGDEAVQRRMDAAGAEPIGPLKPQGFAIRKTVTQAVPCYWAVGADEAGAMYAGLHLAEQIRLGKGLDSIQAVSQGPHILRRGIKFNIPLDARTPSYDDTGDSAQKNYESMWDFSFWQQFLDDMARYRYNTLTLWNPHPFPSLVKLPDYPDVALDDVCVTTLRPTYQSGEWRDPMFVHQAALDNLKVVKRMSIDEKIAFWRRVMQHAKDRGIDIYWITWNVLTNGVQGKYGITDAQDNPKTIAYLRQCTAQCILTYPLLAGIGVTAGENMRQRDDEFSKEKWLWAAYGEGVLDAKRQQPGRQVRFLHRVWQTGVQEVMDDFGSKYPDTFELGFKYARAHLYSSPRPPFAEELCREMKPFGLKCWWNLRNDDIFNFRWGDPDYVREFLMNLPPEQLTAGYHMGSDGYVWGREHTSLEPETPRQLEIDKHWYNFMLWGRLGYDPALDADFFAKVIQARFPDVPGAYLEATWAESSKIIPLVNRFHWNDWDFMWAVEGCMDQRKGFHTVDDFIKTPPMEGSRIMGIPEFVDGQIAGRKPTGITPVEVAEQLRTHARDTLAGLAMLRQKSPQPGKELRQTLADIEAMAHLGDYYSAKILGAVELCAFRKTKDPKRREAAIAHLERAVQSWHDYATVAASLYQPQLLARTRSTDWMQILDDVRQDVEIARSAKVD